VENQKFDYEMNLLKDAETKRKEFEKRRAALEGYVQWQQNAFYIAKDMIHKGN